MTPEPTRIFVYGTLMSGIDSAMGRSERVRFHARARSLGPATVAGRLYDLGRYPGLVLDDRSGRVHGELLEIVSEPDIVLAELDRYEGIEPRRPGLAPYRRIETVVRLASGISVGAWVYELTAVPARARLVDGGHWRTPDAGR